VKDNFRLMRNTSAVILPVDLYKSTTKSGFGFAVIAYCMGEYWSIEGGVTYSSIVFVFRLGKKGLKQSLIAHSKKWIGSSYSFTIPIP
jgi:hypothetical protein